MTEEQIWEGVAEGYFRDIDSPLNIISIIRSRKVNWVGQVARMKREGHTLFWRANLK